MSTLLFENRSRYLHKALYKYQSTLDDVQSIVIFKTFYHFRTRNLSTDKLENSEDPDEMQQKCGISSGTTLFAKIKTILRDRNMS